MKEQDITLNLSRSQIRDMLKPHIKNNTLLDAVVQSADEHSLDLIVKGALGIIPKMAYSTGNQIYVRSYPLSTWNWDKDKMKELGHINTDLNDDAVKAKVVNIKPFSQRPYLVQYSYIPKDHPGGLAVTSEWIGATYIEGPVEEWPEEFYEGI